MKLRCHHLRAGLLVAVLTALAMPGHAALSNKATTNVYLGMNNYCALEATSDISLTPKQADFEKDYIAAEKAIRLKIQTNDLKGCTVSVQKAAVSTIRQGDLQIKGSSGGGFVNYGGYKAPTPTPNTLYKSNFSDGNVVERLLDIRVLNLRKYPGGSGGSKAVYTDTLTFIVTPN